MLRVLRLRAESGGRGYTDVPTQFDNSGVIYCVEADEGIDITTENANGGVQFATCQMGGQILAPR